MFARPLLAAASVWLVAPTGDSVDVEVAVHAAESRPEALWRDGRCRIDPCPAYVADLVAHFERAYDFYRDLGWRSDDGRDSSIAVFAPGEIASGARHVATSAGESYHFDERFIALDIVGHELTHAVIDAHGGLGPTGESGALGESLADLMGNLVEGDLPPGRVGESSLRGTFRDMCHPTSHGHPDHYDDFVVTQDDDGGVHINAGIPNRAWCEIAERFEQAGMSNAEAREKLAQIGFATIQSLSRGARFEDARVASMWAAHSLGPLGTDPNGHACIVAAAWSSVGVTGGGTWAASLCPSAESAPPHPPAPMIGAGE